MTDIKQSSIVFKGRCRWTFGVKDRVPEEFVKIGSFPTGEPIRIAWASSVDDKSIDTNAEPIPLFKWMAGVYNLSSKDGVVREPTEEELKSLTGLGVLTAYDYAGNVVKRWHLHDVYPTSIDFGEECYGCDEVEIGVTCKYSKFEDVDVAI